MIKPNIKAILIQSRSAKTAYTQQPQHPYRCSHPPSHVAADPNSRLEARHRRLRRRGVSPLLHSHDPPPSRLVSLGHPRTVSTGSVSKAHALPGMRVGWVISQDKDIVQRVVTPRVYTMISVSLLDDSVAAFALSKEVPPPIPETQLADVRREHHPTRRRRHARRAKMPLGQARRVNAMFPPDSE